MTNVNGLNQYRTYQAETVAPEDQIALLYQGAQRFIDRAVAALEQERFIEVSENVGKAQRIFAELSAALNPAAGEISQNLARLYDYWTWRLSQGLIRKDAAALREVSATVGDLAGAWAEAARQVRVQRAQAHG
ncbi:flagellar protein FliS [Symbiobacterium terraclitae]|uniref:Flagellar secretion chaperone FliS n=1 Tax=Symbiobacterium terraclitae TaxID=557451 RepID=A0ABS4JNB6_9FIRM|nr:flagellar export chaperone FliS [Symbiobacterium terraclitae]MBP2017020.1 flagellar protein FliS [Symbiobacterium terraclitae]